MFLQALKLFNEGAVLVLKDVPPATEFGIDTHSWNVGEKFLGLCNHYFSISNN